MTPNSNSIFFALPNTQNLPTQKTAVYGYNFLLSDLKVQANQIFSKIKLLKTLQQSLRSTAKVNWTEVDKVKAQIDTAYKNLEAINLEIKMYVR